MLALLALSVPAAAQPFAAPWIGYDAGSSAYPGNPAPFERDPTAIAAGDINGDGHPDVVVANYEYAAPGGGTDGMSGFAVLFNAGDGTYGAPVHYTVSSLGCWDVALGDLDGDGDLDLVVPIADTFWETGNSVRVYRNDGSGAFADAQSFATGGAAPTGVSVADFDGDGNLDVAATAYQSMASDGVVSVMRGNGAGQLGPAVNYVVGVKPFKVEAGDLDGDGRPELVVAHDWQMVSVLRNDGTGDFGAPEVHDALFPPQGGMAYSATALADVDNDGDLDVFYSNTRTHPVGVSVARVVRLVNNAGVLTRGEDVVLSGDSSGPTDLDIADLNGDGWLDLVGLYHGGGVYDGPRVTLNDGAGGFQPVEVIPAGQGTFAVTTADVDTDGDRDLLTADRFSMAVTVHLNPGDGRFPVLADRYDTGTMTNLLLDIGDVDGDGDQDLFSSGESLGMPGALLRSNGDGTFAAPVNYTHSTTYGRGVSRAKLRDLDGDGDLDLLYNDAHTDFFTGWDFWVGLNDGTGTFGPLVEWDTNTCGNGDVDAFDLDNDGDLDVVNLEELACPGGVGTARRLFISLNNGDATFAPPYTVEIGMQPHMLAGGDLNHDGNIDLVTAHWHPYGARDFVNVHIGNGDGTFQEEVEYTVGRGPRRLLVVDLDGDGHLDIATANSSDEGYGRETMTTLYGTSTGAFAGRSDYYAPYSPDLQGATGIAAADVDADGDLDLMVTTVANGVAMYYSDGARGYTSRHRLGVYWRPNGAVVHDFDADGLLDLATLTSVPPGGLGSELSLVAGLEGVVTAPEPASPPAGGPAIAVTVAPNPAAGRATVTVSSGAAAEARVELFDVVGRRVATLFDGALPAGAHAILVDADVLAPGVYVVRAVAGDHVSTARLVVRR